MIWNYPAEIALHTVLLSLYLLYNHKCISTGRVFIMLYVNESGDAFPNSISYNCFSQVFLPTHSLCECHFAYPNSKLFFLPATAALTAPSSTWKQLYKCHNSAFSLLSVVKYLEQAVGETPLLQKLELQILNSLAWQFLMLPLWNLHLPHCNMLCYQPALRQGFCSQTLA